MWKLIFVSFLSCVACETLFFHPQTNPNKVCPDGHVTCPKLATCCKMTTGKYGCCPLLHAVCCKDHIHCCPFKTKCDLKHLRCFKGSWTFSIVRKIKADPVNKYPQRFVSESVENLGNVVCPDHRSQCPSRTTCCFDGTTYRCCPYSKAVCCSDHKHCCPHNAKCDLKKRQCIHDSGSSISFARLPATLRATTTTLHPIFPLSNSKNIENFKVVCPDKFSNCPGNTTCCILRDGKYGCCSFPNAVCCMDKLHCCPNGYSCNLEKGQCVPAESSANSNEHTCHDKETKCTDKQTCCKLKTGGYGCCSFPKATCCRDGKHCCPHGYRCLLGKKVCIRHDSTVNWLRKVAPPAKASMSLIPVQAESTKLTPQPNKICPGGKRQCPDQMTCCRIPSGWGCCPLRDAVCCKDKQHCCPYSFACTSTGCTRAVEQTNLIIDAAMQKVPVISPTLKPVVCPGGRQMCPNAFTCCLQSNGTWGCCSFTQAVCCPDHIHCCPFGYTCFGKSSCVSNNKVITASTKIPSHPLPPPSPGKGLNDMVPCPGGGFSCPSTSTCCRMVTKQWACCPFKHAVCCTDGVHCCPHGHVCSASGCTTRSSALIAQPTPPSTLTFSPAIICPGGVVECNYGWTCCLTVSGTYGCCPHPRAVCCPDRQHCCPEGTQCTAYGCIRSPLHKLSSGSVSKPLTALTKPAASNVLCPGGLVQCAGTDTCCLLPIGHYGCCPYPNAKCCDDREHCCPEGANCTATGCIPSTVHKVSSGSVSKPLTALTKPAASNVLCPGGLVQCAGTDTCCLLPIGHYGCCPYPNAKCCDDREHCCPEGANCTATGCIPSTVHRMSSGSVSKPLTALTKPAASNVLCPGGLVQCAGTDTCCLFTSGHYGCCPYPNAVCCPDREHCCPEGTQCTASGCISSTLHKVSSGSVSKPLTALTKPAASNVLCPGGLVQCAGTDTCCLLPIGHYGCCQYPNAVCCPDRAHCCPEGTQCTSSGCVSSTLHKVSSGSVSKPLTALTKPAASNVLCPGGLVQCAGTDTCCLLPIGHYGCCQYPNAVCCPDRAHCCPEGTQCTSSGCISSTLHEVSKALTELSKPDIICPGGSVVCPDDYTCCLMTTGQFGCCPLPNAVCCSDRIHCCPEGDTCESNGTCVKHGFRTPAATQIPGKSRHLASAATVTGVAIICPDKKSKCPTGNTCCHISKHRYGCCPLPQAVCCSDYKHCCPHGYTCNKARGTCTRSDHRLTLTKIAASTSSVAVIVCPDHETECPSGNTCCHINPTMYGCCPLPEAVCCADDRHCCPHGYACDPIEGVCFQGHHRIPYYTKMPGTTSSVSIIVCPDGKTECPTGSTCCHISPNTYGCCPLPQAVCCSDGQHCCPHGYTCDTTQGTCIRGHHRIPYYTKISASPSNVASIVCPDHKSECPTGSTCCRTSSQDAAYGCCPLPGAVCCSDHVHCCPHGYTCNLSLSICHHGNHRIPFYTKIPAIQTKFGAIICPDHHSRCPTGNTCCLLRSNKYGCCPLPQAVCCSDHINCCPHGYECTSVGCQRGTSHLAFSKNTAVGRYDGYTGIMCPDHHSECPDGFTCCEMTTGFFGCCPLPSAVCCADHIHCCPSGYTCGASGCYQADKFIAFTVPVLASPRMPIPGLAPPRGDKTPNVFSATKGSSNVICPGGRQSCPSGTTCCLMTTGGYGCCPLPKAVCCIDDIHCCPDHTHCDLEHLRCIVGNTIHEMVKKIPASTMDPK